MESNRVLAEKGNRVKITLEGVVQSFGRPQISILTDNGSIHDVFVADPTITVEKVATPEPESWPPIVGDLWIARDVEYFARYSRVFNYDLARAVDLKYIVMTAASIEEGSALHTEYYYSARRGMHDFLALEPTLVRPSPKRSA